MNLINLFTSLISLVKFLLQYFNSKILEWWVEGRSNREDVESLDSAIINLELRCTSYRNFDFYQLKKKLKLMRTFFLCAGNWIDNIDDVDASPGLKDAVRKILLKVADPSIPLKQKKRRRMIGDVLKSIDAVEQQFIDIYSTLCDRSVQSSSSMRVEFIEYYDSLQENLMDLMDPIDDNESFYLLIRDLGEKLTFLKNMICFVKLRGIKQRQLEELLIYSGYVGVKAAWVIFLCSFNNSRYSVEEKGSMIFELLQMIKPVDSQIGIYLRVLSASSSLAREINKHVMGDFVDSIFRCLWDVVNNCTSFMIFVNDQIQMLYDGLSFLRTILKKQQQKFDELDEEIKHIVGLVAKDAGIVMFLLSQSEMKGGLTQELKLALIEFQGRIELIKREIRIKYPAKRRSNVSRSSALSNVSRNCALGFFDIVLENLKNQTSTSKIDSNSFARDRFETIKEDLVFLRSFLENTMEQWNQHEKPQSIWDRFVEVSYKLEFVADCLLISHIPDFFPMLLDTIIEEIKLIKTKALESEDGKYGYESQRAAKTLSQVPPEGKISTINEVVVGFDDEAKTIIDKLTRGLKRLDIISIVGMPGLGKTTLAKKIYNDPSVRYHFHIRAWCTVSQVYCKKDLIFEILDCIDPKLSKQSSQKDEHDLAEMLWKTLKGSRYLIVLDDVWDNEAWNSLKESFPDDAKESRILLTSRLDRVALQIKPDGKPHHLRPLLDDESWELLQKKLFLKQVCPHELWDLGMMIAKNCRGLPLTVVIIAGILANAQQDGWEDIAERLSSSTVCDTEQCMDVLELSYQHLPDYLKPCLLYLGAFPEDREMPISRLMRLWMAEGFVQTSELKSLDDVAEDYMMDLIDRNLVMVVKRRSIGRVKTCRLHDLLHEFCVAKAMEEFFLQVLQGHDEQFSFHDLGSFRRLCIHSKQNNFVESMLFCPRLRSLLFFTDQHQKLVTTYDFSNICRGFRVLRVLDMEEFHRFKFRTFPSELELLVLLRYLAIKVMFLESIRSSIAKLQNLETFVVEGLTCDAISLPDTIFEMKKLRHFHRRLIEEDLSTEGEFVESSFCLSNLQSFSCPTLPCEEKMLRKIPNLRYLRCSPYLHEDSKTIVAFNFLSQLESLRLHQRYNKTYDFEVCFPMSLKKLTLRQFGMSILSEVGKLPNLEVLKLQGGKFAGNVWDMKDEGDFPKLRFLKLEMCHIFQWTGYGEHLPRLEKLMLHCCIYLTEVPSCLGNCSLLQTIKVTACYRSAESFRKIVEELRMGNEDMDILIEKEPEVYENYL